MRTSPAEYVIVNLRAGEKIVIQTRNRRGAIVQPTQSTKIHVFTEPWFPFELSTFR